MARLVHEVWEYVEDGMTLEACCMAGPLGDGCRRSLGPDLRLLTTFEAGNHFEAMTIYNRLLGRGEYSTDQSSDYEPYPDDWAIAQRRAD